MDRLPPLNGLRAFEAVARHGSLSAAARALGVTHGAVSQQIRGLEQALQVRLFVLERRRLHLTDSGRALVPQVQRAFDSLRTMISGLEDPAAGELRLTCVPALLSHWLLPALPEFTRLRPDVSLRILASNETVALRRGDVDIALVYDRPPPDLWSRMLAPVRLFPVVSPALLHRMPVRRTQDLARHVLLHGDDGTEWRNWSAETGVALPSGQAHHLPDARLGIEAAIAGLGVALGDEVTAATALAQGRLVMPLAHSILMPAAFHVVCLPSSLDRPQIAQAIDWICHLAAQSLPQHLAADARGWSSRRR
ncbi:LysR substrate-binding domain-containing protein [Pseudotabrizicola sp. 4114]|uniref:LysR substrate-binding domain-containing protein n=1 Tax=Pseudotabrizicola sp. 4114 TaxID=2817731 RepID=UPI00285618EF|nr:LysR family glycine cleavage system transcriptional activator [Pseudorhodobacter sp. 4114]